MTKHGKAKLVVMNAEAWQILRHGRAFTIEDAPQEVIDLLIDSLENGESGN